MKNIKPLLLSPLFLVLSSICQLAFAQTSPIQLPSKFKLPENPIALARAVRPQVYFDAIGRKAGLLGVEAGRFESWVFPLKLFHDAQFMIQVEGEDSPVEFSSIAERIIVRPESTTIVAANQQYTIRATFFTPIDEPASIVLFDVDSARPLTITVSFVPDLKPMWPAGLGGQNSGWRDDLKAFLISESRRKFNGLFGSPAATRGVSTPAHQLASGALRFDIRVDPDKARRHYFPLIITAGIEGRQPVLDRYQRISASIPELYARTFEHYRRLREEKMSIQTPDKSFDLAFDWAKVALDKGMIDNPELGLGLIAGWGASGSGARPGFGWFFGGDAAINSFAMTGYGDFESMAAAFKFLAKYQRADGKIPHEISQAAAGIRWFDEFPYAYYHADTTPLSIVAEHNLIRQSGDRALLAELWPALKKAYQFCLDNDSDGDGILENSKAGLGASELGSLLANLHQDIYLAATNLEASRSMREFAVVMGDDALRDLADRKYKLASESINARYWSSKENRYAYALLKDGAQNTEVTAWTAVPMMFGQLDRVLASESMRLLGSSRISTDWGTRMLDNQSPAYSPIAYNNGGVWPFLTGFVAAAEYEYDHPHSGFAHLGQLVSMTFDFVSGYHHEILSGDFYRPLDESVPHQLFSSGMVVTPLVRGLLGLRADAINRTLDFKPRIPAEWDRIDVRNFRFDTERIGISYRRENDQTQRIIITKDGESPVKVIFKPPIPYLPESIQVTIDGKRVRTGPDEPGDSYRLQLGKRTEIIVTSIGGFEFHVTQPKPGIGDRTSSLKILDVLRETDNRVQIIAEGLSGASYTIRARGKIRAVSGGTINGSENGFTLIDIHFTPETGRQIYRRQTLSVELAQ